MGRCRWGFCGWSFLPSNTEVLAVEDLSTDARHAPQTPDLPAHQHEGARWWGMYQVLLLKLVC